MVFDGAIQVDEDRTPENGGISLADERPGEVCDAGGVMRA